MAADPRLRVVHHRRGRARSATPPRPLAPILLFILGFTIVFTLLGAFSSTLVRVLRGTVGQRVGGAVVIVLGLLMIGYAFRRGSIALYAERRPFLHKVRPGLVGALPLGMAFAAGWTPCIGPVLGGILAMAGNGSVARGMFLLACYSMGLGVPFLLVGLGITKFMGAFGWIKRHYQPIAAVSGGLLVVVGCDAVHGGVHAVVQLALVAPAGTVTAGPPRIPSGT